MSRANSGHAVTVRDDLDPSSLQAFCALKSQPEYSAGPDNDEINLRRDRKRTELALLAMGLDATTILQEHHNHTTKLVIPGLESADDLREMTYEQFTTYRRNYRAWHNRPNTEENSFAMEARLAVQSAEKIYKLEQALKPTRDGGVFHAELHRILHIALPAKLRLKSPDQLVSLVNSIGLCIPSIQADYHELRIDAFSPADWAIIGRGDLPHKIESIRAALIRLSGAGEALLVGVTGNQAKEEALLEKRDIHSWTLLTQLTAHLKALGQNESRLNFRCLKATLEDLREHVYRRFPREVLNEVHSAVSILQEHGRYYEMDRLAKQAITRAGDKPPFRYPPLTRN